MVRRTGARSAKAHAFASSTCRLGGGKGDIRSIVESHLAQDPDSIETLLIHVEDPVRLEMMSKELGDEGYRIAITSDGSEVLALARQEHPDLILLDMLARNPEALEVATVLKQDPRTLNIPVLFLTSMNDPQEGDERLGAASFLVRPAGTAALVSTIQGVLGAGVSPAGRVLVVEQDDEAREILVMMIQAHGYRVTEAAGPGGGSCTRGAYPAGVGTGQCCDGSGA